MGTGIAQAIDHLTVFFFKCWVETDCGSEYVLGDIVRHLHLSASLFTVSAIPAAFAIAETHFLRGVFTPHTSATPCGVYK